MHNRIFHAAQIRELAFTGLVTVDGPYITCDSRYGGVALGVCGLRKFLPDNWDGRKRQEGWWLVKYDDQPKTDLTDLTDVEVAQLSDEFGIVLLDPCGDASELVRQNYFFSSPAWEALCCWCRAHPRLAKQMSANEHYLPGWYPRSLEVNNGCVSSP